jgi:hypothetical protein
MRAPKFKTRRVTDGDVPMLDLLCREGKLGAFIGPVEWRRSMPKALNRDREQYNMLVSGRLVRALPEAGSRFLYTDLPSHILLLQATI